MFTENTPERPLPESACAEDAGNVLHHEAGRAADAC